MDITSAPPADRPDLQKKSVVFATLKGIALGAVVGATCALAHVTFKSVGQGRVAFKELLSEMFASSTMMGGFFGFFGMGKAAATNVERDRTRPYIEKLEQERESLVKDIVKNNGR